MKKRFVLMFACVTLIFFVSEGISEIITPRLKTLMKEKDTGDLIRVNISMAEQIDPSQVNLLAAGKSVKERREIVIQELKRFTDDSQNDVLSYLREMEKAGEVKDLRSLWINNMITGKMTKGVIHLISKMDGVREIDDDPFIKMIEATKSEVDPPRVATVEWNIIKVDAPCAWALGFTGQGVIVGNLDTGVNYNHVDLRDHFWRNDAEFFGTFGVDDDGNGYIDDIRGYDFINNDGDPIDDHGHGTHTAGTVAGDGTAGDTVGVATDAVIIGIKVLNSGGSGTWSAIFNGVQYGIDNGAHILTLSLGGGCNTVDANARNAFDNALLVGVVSSIAAGNCGPPGPSISTPGSVPPPWRHPDQVAAGGLSGSITVGGTNSSDGMYFGSGRGPVTWETVSPWFDYPMSNGGLIDPDVTAPGQSVRSITHNNNAGYTGFWDGTSMATPHVAGLAALMLSKNPSLTPAEIDSIIETTSVDLGAVGKDNSFGAGRIDCCAAINAVPTLTTPWINRLGHMVDDSGGNNNGIWEGGETVNLIITLNNIGANSTNVQAELSAGGDPLVTLVDSSATFGDIAQGDTSDNTSNPYIVTLDPSACPGYVVYFSLHITADPGFSRDVFFNIATGIVPAASADHDVWNGIYTITENGALGFEDVNVGGQGFRYPGAGGNWLYYGGFAVGNSSSYVADRWYSTGGGGETDLEVILCEALSFGQTVYSDQDGLVSYSDSGHATPQGIKVTQDSWAWSDPIIDDFVIMRFNIQNEGASPVNGLYAGTFMDYDIPDTDAQNNEAGTVLADRLAYMNHASNPGLPYCGVCLLDPNTAANLSVIDHDIYVYPAGEPTDQTKNDFLNGALSSPTSNRPYDWSIVVSAGPFDLNPGQNESAVFAIVGGNDLTELQTHCQRADSIYDATVGIEESEKEKATGTKYALYQNIPNPFTQRTAISYQLRASSHTTLKIYDLSGRIVRTLINEEMEAGRYAIQWDGMDDRKKKVSSGIYFYRLEAQDFRATEKLVLLR
jgi:hypothetical protein